MRKSIENFKNFDNLIQMRVTMEITDIKIRKIFDEKGPLKAIASVTIDNALAVHDVKVIFAKEKYFIVMPSRVNPDGSYRDIVHPINAAFRATLEDAVIRAYREALAAASAKAEASEETRPSDI